MQEYSSGSARGKNLKNEDNSEKVSSGVIANYPSKDEPHR